MKKTLRNSLIACLLSVPTLTSSLFSDLPKRAGLPKIPATPAPAIPSDLPWFTGPLLAPSTNVVPKHHVNMEPYVFFTVVSGIYNNHWSRISLPHNLYSTNVQIPVQIGLGYRMDVQVIPGFTYNHTKGASYTGFGDLPIIFDVQILSAQRGKWWPSIKFSYTQNIPFGKYDHLKARRKGTDAIGAGNWAPNFGLTFGKLFHFGGVYYMATRYNISYSPTVPVHVKGLNFYGGGQGTRGKVYVGNSLKVDIGMEIGLSKNWVFALDVVYLHVNKNRFSGKTIFPVGNPSAEQFSLAPAIEYNWNANIGIIGGAWFSYLGRNIAQFTSAVVAFNVYI